MSRGTRFANLRVLVTAAAMAGILVVSACDGENLFTPIGQSPGGSVSEPDSTPPTVEITQPQPNAQNAKPLGDSILVTVDVADGDGLSRVVFGGVAKRGDPSLGTDRVVERFESKTVVFPAGVTDTTGLRRYLRAVPDTTRETAFIFVEAYDTLGNRGVDTVQVVLGGPDVQILNLLDRQTRASGRLALDVLARDPNGVEQVQIKTEGAYESTLVVPITPSQDSLRLDTAIVIPVGVEGRVNLTASARSSQGVVGQVGPYVIDVVTGEPADTIPPEVAQEVTFQGRIELSDSVTVEVTALDNAEGAGVASMGITVQAFAEVGSDTAVASFTQTIPAPETGPVTRTFRFAPFNVADVELPERVVFQITSFAVDAAGNCAANSTDDLNRSSACVDLGGTDIATATGASQSLSTNVVSGRTVALPSGGRINDAVVDTVRRNLFLSNHDLNRVEHFDMVVEEFRTPVRVGSQPWGLSVNNCYPFSPYNTSTCGDTLIVANSGGTNFSFVGLGPRPVGDASEDETVRSYTPVADRANRLLTRDVVPFNFQLQESAETGVDEFIVTPLNIFSDRPQYLALDSYRRIHFSTEPTDVGSERGTIRKIFLPNQDPSLDLEVQMHSLPPSGSAEDSWGLLHADDVDPAPGRSATFSVLDRQVGTSIPVVVTSGAADSVFFPDDIIDGVQAELEAQGSDARFFSNTFQEADLAFGDTTFVAASGNGEFVAFAESGDAETARIIMYEASVDVIRAGIPVVDLIINRDDQVQGIGLNYDGTMGVARGDHGYFFTPDLRLQGIVPITSGGAGAVLHPLHANSVSIDNPGAPYRPDTHLAFVASGSRTIDIYDTFHFFQLGEIAIRDVVSGPLRASLPFPGDNADYTCPAALEVTDRDGNVIGQTLEIFQNGNPDAPWPVDGGAGGNEDRCIVLKLYGVTDTGGVVVVDVRKSDILARHPTRLEN